MAETTDEILSQIESQRARLGSNIDELETRVKDTTDWRAQFDKNPLLVMGLALGGGVLLSTLFVGGKKRGSSGYYSSSSQSALNSATAHQRNQVSQTFDQVKAALLAVGSAKLMEFLGDVVPDFQRHFQEVSEKHAAQQNASGSGVNAASSTSTHPVSSATSASVPPTSPAVSM